jgi:hypothetical protein
VHDVQVELGNVRNPRARAKLAVDRIPGLVYDPVTGLYLDYGVD